VSNLISRQQLLEEIRQLSIEIERLKSSPVRDGFALIADEELEKTIFLVDHLIRAIQTIIFIDTKPLNGDLENFVKGEAATFAERVLEEIYGDETILQLIKESTNGKTDKLSDL
jgi:hypothetical protein